MQIKFLTSLVGHGFTYNAGHVAEVDDADAQRLVAAGFAEPVAVKTVETIETATVTDAPIEQAVVPAPLVVKHSPLPANSKAAK